MSDPKATKMTLEEAVEIDRECHRHHPRSDEGCAEWGRAKAIVDQAVKAHKARCDVADAKTIAGKNFVEFQKLRALERGEVQP